MNTSTIPVNGAATDRGPAYPDYSTRELNSYDQNGYDQNAYDRNRQPAPRPDQSRIATAAPLAPTASLDQVRYWVGVGLTALIAALAALVGMVVTHGVLDIPIVIQHGATTTPINEAAYGLSVAGIAIAAGALFAGMLRVAPRPVLYFGWITGILAVLAGLLPFTTSAGLHSQIALGAMNLGVGITIALLIPLAAAQAAIAVARRR